MLGREFYIDLVSRCYKLEAGHQLPKAKPGGAPERVVKEVEVHFAALADAPEFDHYEVAQYLIENWAELRQQLPDVEGALGASSSSSSTSTQS